ncbi:hypothetical protein MVEN_00875800 [Mycena venus]|uniref:Uncharacterized protein n=1 Tax=Mycena venus TaxID=2733690 RepID=A0A8H6YGS0_9AGAR|nr:hypothetical protein MVEN_00875800 [Mycena venus]
MHDDDELSATSEEGTLTPAEKGRRTRALKATQEEAENKRLIAETEQDDMDVDSEPIQKPSKKAPKKVPQTKNSQEVKGKGKEVAARKRRDCRHVRFSAQGDMTVTEYLPDTIQSSDDDLSAQEQASIKSKPASSAAKKSKPVRTTETVIKAGPRGVIVGAQIIELKPQYVAPGPEELFTSDDDDPKPRHHRQASSSSMGSLPPDTDIDFDFEEHHEDSKNDDEVEEDDEEPEVAQVTMSAQKLKYEEEKPVIHSSKAAHPSKVKKAKADPTAQFDWHLTASSSPLPVV